MGSRFAPEGEAAGVILSGGAAGAEGEEAAATGASSSGSLSLDWLSKDGQIKKRKTNGHSGSKEESAKEDAGSVTSLPDSGSGGSDAPAPK